MTFFDMFNSVEMDFLKVTRKKNKNAISCNYAVVIFQLLGRLPYHQERLLHSTSYELFFSCMILAINVVDAAVNCN